MNLPTSSLPVACAAAALLALTACSKPTEATAENFGAAMNTYLAQRGNLCLAKTTWPIDVTQHEIEVGARNAVQMPALEKLGLVRAAVADVDVKDEDEVHHMQVRRYALTDEGRKYYLVREFVRPDGKKISQRDFCAARLSLDKVVRWEADPAQKLPGAAAGPQKMVVTYTYKVRPAPWTSDAAVQHAFPVVAGVVRGAGRAQLKETVSLTDTGWVAVDLQGS